ncbi:Kinesin-like protein KIF11 [Zancudomyces culisetae]|uniref:Kinesin-like protein KIF11 n=1 Tax=Zancudomyces culisetae TaxID=1213189 RepID=A0A1R1PKD7_ZANCU|nr:Kinesin-like protein KIF11 [Zancudomyces culisetae]|eukprot:OMH81438.1 Kinesin-like protein KIF11 [Zancudomyces culisetae]
MDETLSTLEYANRAKCIRNRPEVNKKIARTVLVSELQAQIEKLQADMTSTILKNGVYLAPERYQELVELEKYKNGAVDEWKKKVDLREDELKEAHKQLEGLKDKMDRYVEQEREYKQRLVKQQEEIQRTKTELQGTKVRLVQQKYISKARGRGEEKLVEAAERLMQIVSKSNNSITGLLEVVDKSTELGAQNLEALEDYSVKIQQQHKSLVNKLGSGAAEFSKSLGGVASGLTVEMQRVFGDDFKADFERLVQEYQSLVASEAQKCALIMERETQKIRSDMDEFKARYIDARESIGSNIQKLSQESSEVLEKIYRNIQESRDKATKLFGEMSDHSESFMTQTYEGLQECKTNMQKYNDVYESTTNENNRDIELQIAELQKERESAKEQLLLDYEKIMNEMKLRFEQALKTQNTKWAKVITDLHTINETNRQKSLEIDRHRHQLAENLDTLCQTSHTLGEQLSTNNQQGLSSLGSDFDSLSTSVSQLNSTLKHSTKAVGLAVDKQLDAIEPQPMVGQINERLESKDKGVSIATSAIESHVSSVFTKVESNLMEKERDKLSQTTKVFADNLSNTAGQITTELGSLVSEVNKTVQPTISDCISGSMNRSKILLEHNQRIKRQKIAHNIGWEVSVPEKIITERITCVVDDNNSGVNSGEADDSWLTIPVLGSIESVIVDGLDTKAKLNTSFSQPSTVQAADTPRKKLRENGALVNALKRKLELQNQQDARNNNNEAEIGVGVESESESFNDNHNDTVLGSDEDFRNSAVSTPSALPIPLSLNTSSSAIANSDGISNNVSSDSTSSFGFKRKNSNLVLNNSIGNADKNRFSRGFFHNTNR